MLIRKARFFLTRVIIKISFLFSEVSDFFHSMPAAMLRPDDLIELNKLHYAKPYIVKGWINNAGLGLSRAEEHFCSKYAFPGAKVLVIGCGPGREVLTLARQGFDVTAIDSSSDMIQEAGRVISSAGVKAELRALSLYEISSMKKNFDMIFLGVNYGMIPTRRLRIEVLRSVLSMLSSSGALYLSFTGYKPSKREHQKIVLYKMISYLALGNRGVEKGDIILGTGEFHHCFVSADEVIKEAVSAGFTVDGELRDENAIFLKKKGPC